MGNPFYITMKDYLKILEEILIGFDDPSHPEDVGAAVESANKNVEAVLAYQVRKWYDDQKRANVKASSDLYEKINVSGEITAKTDPDAFTYDSRPKGSA